MFPCISLPLPPSGQKPVSKVKVPSLGADAPRPVAQWEQLHQWKRSWCRSSAPDTADVLHWSWKVPERSEFPDSSGSHSTPVPVVQNTHKGFPCHLHGEGGPRQRRPPSEGSAPTVSLRACPALLGRQEKPNGPRTEELRAQTKRRTWRASQESGLGSPAALSPDPGPWTRAGAPSPCGRTKALPPSLQSHGEASSHSAPTTLAYPPALSSVLPTPCFTCFIFINVPSADLFLCT